MDTTYLAAWLLAGVVAIGLLSWALARFKRSHDLRLEQAQRLVRALER